MLINGVGIEKMDQVIKIKWCGVLNSRFILTHPALALLALPLSRERGAKRTLAEVGVSFFNMTINTFQYFLSFEKLK